MAKEEIIRYGGNRKNRETEKNDIGVNCSHEDVVERSYLEQVTPGKIPIRLFQLLHFLQQLYSLPGHTIRV